MTPQPIQERCRALVNTWTRHVDDIDPTLAAAADRIDALETALRALREADDRLTDLSFPTRSVFEQLHTAAAVADALIGRKPKVEFEPEPGELE